MAFPANDKSTPPANPSGPPRPRPSSGMPRPGQGIDPMAAMMGGLGGLLIPPVDPGSGLPGGGMSESDGLPLGGAMPPPGSPDGNSGLLAALMGPQPMGDDLVSAEGQDNRPLSELLNLLALAQLGLPPDGPSAGSAGMSGVSESPFNPGQTIGLPPTGFMNGWGS